MFCGGANYCRAEPHGAGRNIITIIIIERSSRSRRGEINEVRNKQNKKQTKKKTLISFAKNDKKNYSTYTNRIKVCVYKMQQGTFGGIFAYYPFIRPRRRQRVYRFRRNNRFPDEESIVSILVLCSFVWK